MPIPDGFVKHVLACVIGSASCFGASNAQELSQLPNMTEFLDPPVCSSFEPIPQDNPFGCEIIPNGTDGNGDVRNTVKISLTAQTKTISVGGESIKTENYGTYLPPVVEARAGDTVILTLKNELSDPIIRSMHEHHCEPDNEFPNPPPMSNPTNMHYFHGGIVPTGNGNSDGVGIPSNDVQGGPMNSARWGTGDNIYSCLERDQEHTYKVKIPGFEELNAVVLDGKVGEKIAHPPGLNWYHTHLHGISSNQVLGGMAGLLSVGRRDANLRANCEDLSLDECEKKTAEISRNTLVKYALLRDISIEMNDGIWLPDPDGQNFGQDRVCGVIGEDGVTFDTSNTGLRKGFCQPNLNGDQSAADPNKLWLFTINGQKFPTIDVDETKTGILLRLGNLSPNFAYWLELYDEETSEPENDNFVRKNMTIVSVDGVVPAKPQSATDGVSAPVASYNVPDLLLMPASRVEIYIDRGGIPPKQEKTFVLRTKELKTGLVPTLGLDLPGDQWPEIQLARIRFKAIEQQVDPVQLALNAAISGPVFEDAAFAAEDAEPRGLPPGCMRDLREGEYRKVEFKKDGVLAEWKIVTSIMKDGSVVQDEDGKDLVIDTSFEAYLNKDGSIKWDGGTEDPKLLHTCIRLQKGENVRPQLWELSNPSAVLHNFHIHQMKFRLATIDDLNDHGIGRPRVSSVCDGVTDCDSPDYKFYEPEASQGGSISNLGRAELPDGGTISSIIEWHDTIPMPPLSVRPPATSSQKTSPVYVMMSFADAAQVGRFVYHCHILKHEDKGLMAPIEVWNPDDPG